MAEKDTETKKKKRGSAGKLVFLLILFLIAALLFFLMHFGLLGFGGSGLGFGSKGDGQDSAVSSAADSVSEAEDAPAETTVEEKIFAEVTVKENEYLYQNGTMTLDALTEELKKLGEDVTVRITDENAAKQAFDALTAELDALNIAYEKAES